MVSLAIISARHAHRVLKQKANQSSPLKMGQSGPETDASPVSSRSSTLRLSVVSQCCGESLRESERNVHLGLETHGLMIEPLPRYTGLTCSIPNSETKRPQALLLGEAKILVSGLSSLRC